MKITMLRVMAFALFTAVMSFVGSTSASAQTVRIQYGTPPPPPPPGAYHAWARPSRNAVWIPGHNEFIRGRWVWVGGYYTYPPRHGGYWVQPRYRHGYYYPGYWAY